MLIFPEGGRSPDGWGQPFRGGAAYLSSRCGVPGRAGPPRGHRPHPAQGHEAADAGQRARHLRRAAAARRGRERRPLRRAHRAGRRRRWPTRPPPTGGRPASGPPPARPRASPAPMRRPGAGPGPSATAAGSVAVRPGRGRSSDAASTASTRSSRTDRRAARSAWRVPPSMPSSTQIAPTVVVARPWRTWPGPPRSPAYASSGVEAGEHAEHLAAVLRRDADAVVGAPMMVTPSVPSFGPDLDEHAGSRRGGRTSSRC